MKAARYDDDGVRVLDVPEPELFVIGDPGRLCGRAAKASRPAEPSIRDVPIPVEHIRHHACVDDIVGCFACDLSHGRVHLPGGSIHRTDHWVVEHCAGPLGVGTLIVKPSRHLVHVSDLTQSEATEMGPLLRCASSVVMELARPEQVYVCLWSHGPVHIHFVVQPVDSMVMAEFGAHGPKLQVAMFESAAAPDETQVQAFADAARQAFRRS